MSSKKHDRGKKLIATVLGIACLLAPCSSAIAQPQPQEGAEGAKSSRLLKQEVSEALRSGRMTLNYKNVPIPTLARLMADLTGRNIVLDNQVVGQLTILSSTPVTPEQAWDIFVAAIERYGFTALDKGSYTQILPTRVTRAAAPLYQTGHHPKGEQTSAVVVLDNLDVNVANNAIRPLLSEGGILQPYVPGKALIISDRAEVVEKVIKMAKRLDRAHPQEHVSVVYPTYARAKDIVPVIQKIAQSTQGGKNVNRKDALKIEAFDPSNAVVTHGSAEQIKMVKKILSRLDIPSAAPQETEEPQFYTLSLQHAQAEEVAKILSEMLDEKAQANERLEEDQTRRGQRQNAQNQKRTSASTAKGATGKSLESAPKTAFVSSKVASDPETNSLVLFVSPSQFAEVQKLVAKLDMPRKQVMVSAVVAEVSLGSLVERGLRFQVLTKAGALSSFNAGVTEEGLLSFLSQGNFVVGASGAGSRSINVNGRTVKVPELFGFLTANDTSNNFNLISAPRVTIQDHKEGEFNVGDVVPFATGARFDNSGQPLITYDYRDVGIHMKVTPHVSQSDTIRLDLDQEVQEVTDFLSQNIGGFGYVVPLISNRKVKTTVTIKDGETLFIGGLISKRTVERMTKVPILGDLPLVGSLFRQKRQEDQKTTLFIALTPQIIDSAEELNEMEADTKAYRTGDFRPGAHEAESNSYIKGSSLSPYDRVADGSEGLETLSIAPIRLPKKWRIGETGAPIVELTNGYGAHMDLSLVARLTSPDGQEKEFQGGGVHFEPGEKRTLQLPAMTLDQVGDYQLDLEVWEAGKVIQRLPLPQKFKVTR